MGWGFCAEGHGDSVGEQSAARLIFHAHRPTCPVEANGIPFVFAALGSCSKKIRDSWEVKKVSMKSYTPEV